MMRDQYDPIQRLALGTVQFGLPYGVANQTGQVSRFSSKMMIQFAEAAGVDTIDTAVGYGDSESCLGEIGVEPFRVVTKLPALPFGVVGINDWVRKQIQSSLGRLGLKQVDAILLHRPLELLGERGQELFDALCALKEGGVVNKIGISIYSPAELETLFEKYHFDLVQGPFNLVDRRFLKSGWLRRLNDRGVEIHTRSTFLQGLLLMPRHAIPAKFSRWNGLWDQWHKWLSSHRVTALSACLAFSWSIPEINRIVVGADSLEQLKQIVGVLENMPITEVPDIECEAEELINPANWSNL